MSDEVWKALIISVPATLTAFAGILVSLRNGKKHDRLEVKTDEIHALTNSAKTQVDKRLKIANEKIASLESSLGTFMRRNKPIRKRR